LTDLGEIDNFVKEQAEAISLGEAALLYRLEKLTAALLTATQMRSVRYAQLWQRESKRTPLIEVKALSLSNVRLS
jgi:hypothetical protein